LDKKKEARATSEVLEREITSKRLVRRRNAGDYNDDSLTGATEEEAGIPWLYMHIEVRNHDKWCKGRGGERQKEGGADGLLSTIPDVGGVDKRNRVTVIGT